MNYKVLVAAALVASLANATTVDTTVPQPWFKNGQAPAVQACLAGIDAEIEARGTPNMTLKCDANVDGFVGVMQNFSAKNYLNKRVRFSALVKAQDVEGRAGLWMRIDDKGRAGAAFDNMQDRPITGTSDWTPYEVVLDASDNADGIFFGMLLGGKGQVWISGIRFEVVDSGVTSTQRVAPAVPSEPGNLGLTH
jgi:hypothetical protein